MTAPFNAARVAAKTHGYCVVDHILHRDGRPVAQRPSPNMGGVIAPTLLILHYTGSTTAASAIGALTNRAGKVSAHLVLDRDGGVTQLVPFNRAAWHAGKSRYGQRGGCNAFSIGLEQVNAGLLARRADGALVTAIGARVVAPDDAVFGRHRITGGAGYWQIYPEPQIEAAVAIGLAMAAAYGIADVVGHEDVAPRRKIDPGPAYPLAGVRSRILGRK